MKSETKNRALEQVNNVRRACGIETLSELKKGWVGDPHSCPIANSLKELSDSDVTVSSGSITIGDPSYETREALVRAHGLAVYNGSDYISWETELFDKFMQRFDSGDYPELMGGNEIDIERQLEAAGLETGY